MVQEAWQPMFDSVATTQDCTRIATGVLSTLKINPERMLSGLSADMLATDLAEYLVRKGMHPCHIPCNFGTELIRQDEALFNPPVHQIRKYL